MNRYLLLLGTLLSLSWSMAVSAQSVTGIVSDENGDPLPGATVLANGGARGVSTDMDGRYTLLLGAGDHEVMYSFVGYLKPTAP